MNETTYKDPERVACLKRDWAELHPTDQAALLVEWGEKEVKDWTENPTEAALKLGKWIVLALAGALALGSTLFLTSCTEVTPAQLQTAHALYHVVSGKPCILYVEGDGK